MSKTKIKIYGGCAFVNGKQVRMIVGATSQVQALEILNKATEITKYYFRGHWSETANSEELKVCNLGEVWYKESYHTSDKYKKLN